MEKVETTKEKTLSTLKSALASGEERIEHLLEHKRKFEADIINIGEDIEIIEILSSIYRREITALEGNTNIN